MRLSPDQLVDPPVVLRLVNRGSLAYMELRDSIKEWGVFTPILVRLSARFPGKYDVVCGAYRTACARDVRRPDVPCLVMELTDDEVLRIQIQENALRPETTPTDYARQFRRIMDSRPGMYQYELATLLHKNPRWIGQILGLEKLSEEFQTAVDRGEMPLGSAYELARIPPIYRSEFFDAARTLPEIEFRTLARGFLKQFMEGSRQGKLDAFFTEKFTPQAFMRPLKEVQAEHDEPQVSALILAAENCTTMLQAWRAALSWVMHLDQESIETRRQAALSRNRKKVEVFGKQS